VVQYATTFQFEERRAQIQVNHPQVHMRLRDKWQQRALMDAKNLPPSQSTLGLGSIYMDDWDNIELLISQEEQGNPEA
jgi:hypothetical protein